MKYRNFLLAISFTLFFGCDTTVQNGSGSGRILPNVTGGAGEVLVVMDNYLWDGKTGEMLKDILLEEFPGLPQSEPMFDVAHISSSSFDKLFKYHRSVILVTLNQTAKKPSVRFRKDVWAKTQIVVQIEAASGAELLQLIEENKNKIQNFLVQYDRQRLIDSYVETKDIDIQKEMAEKHHISLAVPRGYTIDLSNENYTSVSIESSEFSQVLQVYEYSATKDDLQSGKLLLKRNEIVGTYVKGQNEGSYMTTSSVYPPIISDLNFNNMEIVEIRGLWDLEGGYMGGPFISHSVFDSTRNRIVTVEGYVYYPNQKKRVKIKQLEAIIYSMTLI